MLDKMLDMEDIHFTIKNIYGDDVYCAYSNFNDGQLIFRIRLKLNKKSKFAMALDQSDAIYMLQNFQNEMLDNVVLRGVKNIKKVIARKITNHMVNTEEGYKTKEEWVLDTVGTNLLDILSIDYIDKVRTISNDIQEIYKLLGIEAARRAILSEITEVIEFDDAYINYHHLSLLCDRMTCNHNLVSIFRHGINNDDIGPIAKASFEETPEMFLRAARHGELDTMRGISANVMCGQQGYFGTNAFQVFLDMKEMMKREQPKKYEAGQASVEDALYDKKMSNKDGYCSKDNINISSNLQVSNVMEGNDDEDYDVDF